MMDEAAPNSDRSTLTPGDWLICIICQLGGILIGASRCALGEWRSGLAMIGLSCGMAVAWNLMYVLIQGLMRSLSAP